MAPVDDEAFLDDLFEQATVLLQQGAPLDLERLLGARPHLRAVAAAELATLRALYPPAAAPGLPQIPGLAVEAELGHGGMGTVYRARDLTLGGRLVAVKVLQGVGSARQRARFVAEANALAKVRHDHVVMVHAVREHADGVALVMELVEGRSLAALLKDPAPVATLAPARLVAMARDLARARAAVHAAGLVHRDVKPANVLVREDGKALLSDFGLARDPEQSLHTQAGEFVGTAAYAAPEQLRGEVEHLDGRADVYGLGATLYHALAGEPPAGSGSSAVVLQRLEQGRVLPLRRHNAAVSRDLETIVANTMELEPARRYASAAALADDLDRLLALQPIAARPVGLPGRMLRFARRRPAAAVLTALAAVGLPLVALAAILVAPRLLADLAREREADYQERLATAFVALSEATSVHAPPGVEQEACVALERLARERPDDVEARGGLAWLHLNKGRADSALAVLRSAPASVVRSYALDALCVRALDRTGKSAEAQRVAALTPQPSTPFDILILDARGSGAQTRPATRWAATLRQTIITSSRPRLMDFEILCRIALRDRDVDALPDFVAGMVTLFPGSFAARYRAGITLRALKQPAAALVHLDAALALAPAAATLHNARGNALHDLGDLVAAAAEFRVAINRAPEYVEAHYNLANTLHAQGRTEDALAEHGRAIALDERFEWAHMNRAAILAASGRYAELIRHGRRARGLFPKAGWCLWSLGRALYEVDLLAEAEECLQRLTEVSPGDRDGWFFLGEARRRLGRFGPALVCYQTAARAGRTLAEGRVSATAAVLGAEELVAGGDLPPAAQARAVDLALALRGQGLRATAARLFRKRIAVASRDLSPALWVEAAMCALQAGIGATADAVADEAERLRCRQDAEAWLGSAVVALLVRVAAGELDPQQARCLAAAWCVRAELRPAGDGADLLRAVAGR